MSARKKRTFGFESLESRRVLAHNLGSSLFSSNTLAPSAMQSEAREAPTPLTSSVGDMTATLLPNGDLMLNETAGQEGLANGVTISRLANGHILVFGHDPTGLGGPATLINGLSAVEFDVAGNLEVHLGHGDNSLRFDHNLAGFEFHQVWVTGGSGADHVAVAALKTTGSVAMTLAGGDDLVEIATVPNYGLVNIGDGFNWDGLIIDTGAGADEISISGGARVRGAITVHTFDYAEESDSDKVLFDLNVFAERDVRVETGGGVDFVEITPQAQPFQVASGLTTLGALTIDLGAGNDTAYLRGMKTGGDLSILAGDGADRVMLDFQVLPDIFSGEDFLPIVGGDLWIQAYDSLLDASADEVRILNRPAVRGSVIARFGAGSDYFQIDRAEFIGNDLDLDMGAGNDKADVSAFVVDHLMARMGEGNDTLNLGKTWAYRLIADGGNGSDSLITAANTKAQYLDLFGWEKINGKSTWLDGVFAGTGGVYGNP